MNLNEAAERAYKTAIKREQNGAVKISEILKHCAGEVIEAAEARREWLDGEAMLDFYKDDYAEELADVIICALIAAYDDGIDIQKALVKKMQKNLKRAKLEGDKK